MTKKRFSTTGYYIYDHFYDGEKWLVNEVEAEEIVDVMNNLDTKARERSKALSTLQKKLNELHEEYTTLKSELSFSQNQNRELRKILKDNRSMAEVVEENKKLQSQIHCEHIYFGYLKILEDWNKRVEKENKELKRENELLSDELEQCKAVINKKWSEYLKKKME